MEQKAIWVVLVIAGLNYLLRVLPVAVLKKKKLPGTLERFLDFTPCAVMAVMVAAGIFASGERLDFSLKNVYLWASLPTLAAALKTKSLGWTLLVGMLSTALFRLFF